MKPRYGFSKKQVSALNGAKDALNGFIDNSIGSLLEEGAALASATVKTWAQEGAETALCAAKGLLNAAKNSGIALWIKETAVTAADTVAKGAQKVITAAVSVAQGALNLIMNANPIMLIVTAIAALVAGFVLLWNKCEGFRTFVTNFFSVIGNGFISLINLLIKGINMLLEIVLAPINLIIKV